MCSFSHLQYWFDLILIYIYIYVAYNNTKSSNLIQTTTFNIYISTKTRSLLSYWAFGTKKRALVCNSSAIKRLDHSNPFVSNYIYTHTHIYIIHTPFLKTSSNENHKCFENLTTNYSYFIHNKCRDRYIIHNEIHDIHDSSGLFIMITR